MTEPEEPNVEDLEIRPLWSNPVPPPRRAATFFLGEDILARLLHLPDGWHLTGVRDDFERNGILIRLTGPTAPEWAEGTLPWHFTPEVEYEAPSEEELAADPHAAGKLRIILPDWLLEGDDKPWRRDQMSNPEHLHKP